jgi:hypothetical protein
VNTTETPQADPQPQFWLPNLTAKQREIFDCFSRYLLVSGPRRSGKTLGVLHKLVRHAFDVKNARVIMIAKNIKLAKEGGPWDDLINVILPEWEAAGILKVVTPPKLDAQTRSLYCEISNRNGGVTRIYLGSLEHDHDVEKLLRGRKFSFLYFIEATNFKSRSLFDTAVQCLRVGEPDWARQIVMDCNPAEEGEAHWLYKLFWTERTSETPPEQHKTEEDREKHRAFQKQLTVIEVMIPSNTFLTKQEVDELYAQFSYDQDILARYFFGKWVTSTNDGYFAQHFKPAIHVLGNIMVPHREDWETILIPEDTDTMFSGWDLGDKSSVTVFACKETDDKGRSTYSVVDEVVVDNDSVQLEDYVRACYSIIAKWEDFVGHPIKWRATSDTSSFMKKLSARNHEAALIRQISSQIVSEEQASPTRIIEMKPTDKYKGSVNQGIKLMKRLLFENRLFISANCIHTIGMFRSFKPERARGTGVERVPDNEWTHKFDALRYLLQSEEPMDVVMYSKSRVGRAPNRIISIS